MAIASFNQLSGVDAFLYHALHLPDGWRGSTSLLQSVIIGFTMLVFTVFAIFIIDRVGRRKLMIAGSIGYIVGLTGAACALYFKWKDRCCW